MATLPEFTQIHSGISWYPVINVTKNLEIHLAISSDEQKWVAFKALKPYSHILF